MATFTLEDVRQVVREELARAGELRQEHERQELVKTFPQCSGSTTQGVGMCWACLDGDRDMSFCQYCYHTHIHGNSELKGRIVWKTIPQRWQCDYRRWCKENGVKPPDTSFELEEQ